MSDLNFDNPPPRERSSSMERAALAFCVNGCSTFIAVFLALVVFFGSAYFYVRWEVQNAVNAFKTVRVPDEKGAKK